MKRMKQYLIYLALAVAVVLFVLSVVLHVLPDWYVWLSGVLVFGSNLVERMSEQSGKWSGWTIVVCIETILSLLVFLKHLLGL